MMVTMRAEDRKYEQTHREDNIRRQERKMEALKESQTVISQTVNIETTKLPDMRENENIETFITMFEAALRANQIPEGQWKARIHSLLTPRSKIRVQSVIQDPKSSYDDIKEALMGCSMTFSAAAENLMSGERGHVYNLDHRQCSEKLVSKVMGSAGTLREAAEQMAVAFMHYNLNPNLKTYVDMKGVFDINRFSQTLDEWESTQPTQTSCFKRQSANPGCACKTLRFYPSQEAHHMLSLWEAGPRES